MVRCDSCGWEFTSNEVVEFSGKQICAECKPDAVMAVKSGKRPAFLDDEKPFTREDAEALDRIVGPLMAQADDKAETETQPGKFRTITWVWLAVLVVSGVMIATGIEAAMVFGTTMAIIFGLIFVVSFGNDLHIPSPRGRATLKSTMNCFFRGIKTGHWKKARACLSPVGLSTEAAPPKIKDMKIKTETLTFETLSGFKQYWKSFTRPNGTQNRSIVSYTWNADELDPNLVRIRGSLKISRYPQWIIILILINLPILVIVYFCVRKSAILDFDLLMVRHRSQWWVLTGALNSPTDRNYEGPRK